MYHQKEKDRILHQFFKDNHFRSEINSNPFCFSPEIFDFCGGDVASMKRSKLLSKMEFSSLCSELSEKSTELFCLLAIVLQFMQYFEIWLENEIPRDLAPKAKMLIWFPNFNSRNTEEAAAEDLENTIISQQSAYLLNVMPR